MTPTEVLLPDPKLLDAIRCLLEVSDRSLKEYDLIQTLNEQGWSLSTSATNSLDLFTTHFVIYNALYHLQDEYWPDKYLEISALSIVLLMPQASKQAETLSLFQNEAKLREYYLDPANLESASIESVNKLLNEFWELYIADSDSVEAFKVLGLEPPVSYTQLKKHYRSLAMIHHPDRGGSDKQFQRINWAFGVLQRIVSD
jgi:hypothetical protein